MSQLPETGLTGESQAESGLGGSARRLASSGGLDPSDPVDRDLFNHHLGLANTLLERTANSFEGATFDQKALKALELAIEKANEHHLSWVPASYLATAIVSQSELVHEVVPDIKGKIETVEDEELFISGTKNAPGAEEFDKEARLLLQHAKIHAMSAALNAGEGKTVITLDALVYALAGLSFPIHLYSHLLTDEARQQILSVLGSQFEYPQPGEEI